MVLMFMMFKPIGNIAVEIRVRTGDIENEGVQKKSSLIIRADVYAVMQFKRTVIYVIKVKHSS